MKKFLLLCLSLVLIISLSACGEKKKTLREEDFGIVTSFYPVYVTTLNLISGAENVSVVNMPESDQGCLHDYLITKDDLSLLSKADMFIASGLGMETFVGKNSLGIPGLEVVDSGEDIPMTLEERSKKNPHYWMSIKNTIAQSEKIARNLIRNNPENEEVYTKNLAEYKEKLEDLLVESVSACRDMETRDIVALSGVFEYFSEELGVRIITFLQGHRSVGFPETEISELVEYIKSEEIDALVVEKNFSDTSLIKRITKETGCDVIQLDILTEGNAGGEEKDAYINMIKHNIGVLKALTEK